MKRRKTGATVVIAALAAIGLTLPGTAAATTASARSYVPPIGVQEASMIVDLPAPDGSTTDVVSWGDDSVEAVSWGD